MDYYQSMDQQHGFPTQGYASPTRAISLALMLAAGLLLAGVAQAQVKNAAPLVVDKDAQGKPSEPVVNSALTAELMYQLLVGELSFSTGDPGAGYSIILDAARKTNNAQLFQRAMDLALRARSGDSALAAVSAWQKAQPQSREANRYLLQILAGLNRTQDIAEPLKRELALAATADRAAIILEIPRYFTRAADKAAAVVAVEKLMVPYLADPATAAAAWVCVGRMRGGANDLVGALDAVTKAQAIAPTLDAAALLSLNLMSSKVAGAEAAFNRYLQGQPITEIRMDYARVLLDGQRYAEAAVQLRVVTQERPQLARAWLILGSLDLQDGKNDEAEKSLQRYIDIANPAGGGVANEDNQQGLSQAYRSMAQIAEQRKEFSKAEEWLNRVDHPDDIISAQGRRASIMARQGNLEAARELVKNLPERSSADARLKLLTEVQLLRDARKFKAAYDLVEQAAQDSPDDVDLLYDQAMLSEKMGNVADMERLLRQAIASKPDYHQAYNALGYSLAERNLRLPEAKQLIQKALEHAPNDQIGRAHV